MDDESTLRTLRASPLASRMTDEQCRALSVLAENRILQDDEILFAEGDSDDRFYVVIEGMLAVTRDTGGGERVTLHILRACDLAGEMGFINATPHTATLRALGPTNVLGIQRDKLESLLDDDPWTVYRTIQAIVQSNQDTVRRMNNQYVEMSNYISKQHGRY